MLVKINNSDLQFLLNVKKLRYLANVGTSSKAVEFSVNNFFHFYGVASEQLTKINKLELELKQIKDLLKNRQSIDLELKGFL